MLFEQFRQRRKLNWDSYRKIPNYKKTMERVSVEGEEMLLFISKNLPGNYSVDDVLDQIVQVAHDLNIIFDEALYYRWTYCCKLHNVKKEIEDSRKKKIKQNSLCTDIVG